MSEKGCARNFKTVEYRHTDGRNRLTLRTPIGTPRPAGSR
jgi:hypothetical protein